MPSKKQDKRPSVAHIRFNDAMLKRLRAYCEREHRSLANAVEKLVTIALEQVEKEVTR